MQMRHFQLTATHMLSKVYNAGSVISSLMDSQNIWGENRAEIEQTQAHLKTALKRLNVSEINAELNSN